MKHNIGPTSHDGWGWGTDVSTPHQRGQITRAPPPSTHRLIQQMEPCTVLDWFDALWIDFHWLALDIYPLDGAFFCCKFMHEEGRSDIFCIWKLGGEKNIKKTQIRWVYCHGNYLFSPRWSLSLLLWHSPHFPFVASLKSAPCSETQAATREMVNELQTLFWQYFFSFFFFKRYFICADLHCFFSSNQPSSQGHWQLQRPPWGPLASLESH